MHPLLTSDALGPSAFSEARSHFNMLLSQKGCMEQVRYRNRTGFNPENQCAQVTGVFTKTDYMLCL